MADRRDDESIWVSPEASIRYTHKVGSSKALTNFSNFSDHEGHGLGKFSVTVKEEANNDEAVSVCMHQQSYNDPNILKTHSINQTRDGQLVTISERVPPLAFQEWLNKPGFKQWEMSLDGTRLLGLADVVRQVLKQVGDCLKTMMFTRNQCHGRLEEGIRISSNGDVKVMMMTPRQDNLANFEFEQGLKKDIGQFRNLIEKIENVRPLNGPQPSALFLFYQLCDRAQTLSGKALRDMAYFIYGNAAFFSDEEKLKLFFKLKDFLDANVQMIRRLLNFNKEPVQMRNWGQKILQLPTFSPWKVGYKNEESTYQYEAHGIFIFHKNTLSHFSDNDFKSETRQRRLATMKQLSQLFPEFIPKLFFLAATEVRENEDKFGVPDSKTGTIVGGDLVIFLRTGRDALP